MIDKKIIDYVKECDRDTADVITKALDSRFKSLTDLIALDNQNITDRIKEVRDHVVKQNGSIRKLEIWQGECAGMEKQRLSSQQKAKIIISAIVGIAGIGISLIFNLL